MPSFFTGWIGYGTGVQNATLAEPGDPAYVRRPVVFSNLENGTTFDTGSGTVGPASVNWGTLVAGGLFDQPSGGNLLLTWSLAMPVTINAGSTYTTGPARNVFTHFERSGPTVTTGYVSGTVVGYTPDGRGVFANISVQVSGGVLSAQCPSFGGVVTMPTLPSQPPASGSGQIWNNGGVLGVA